MDPQVTQLLSIIGAIAGVLAALGTIFVALVSKFGRGPNERQSEVALGVSVLEKQIERADKEKAGWAEIETFLRNLVKGTDAENKELRKAIDIAEERIRALEDERRILMNRQRNLAAKFARGEAITLLDMTGQEIDEELEELEDTYMT